MCTYVVRVYSTVRTSSRLQHQGEAQGLKTQDSPFLGISYALVDLGITETFFCSLAYSAGPCGTVWSVCPDFCSAYKTVPYFYSPNKFCLKLSLSLCSRLTQSYPFGQLIFFCLEYPRIQKFKRNWLAHEK